LSTRILVVNDKRVKRGVVSSFIDLKLEYLIVK